MKIIFFANTDWYLFNFRLGLARHLASLGHEVVMTSPPGEHGPRLQAAGFRWIPLPMARRSLNPLRETALLLRLSRLYRDEKPDLVHHFTIKCVVYGTLAARLTRVHAVVNAIAGLGHVFVSDSAQARLLRPVVSRLIKLASDGAGLSVILQNEEDLKAFRRMGLSDKASLKLIRGSGVDVTRFRPRAGERLPGPLRVLFVGRLLRDKGIGEFVACASRCHASMPGGLEFLAAGDADPGNPSSVAPGTLARWQAEGHVKFLGQVADMPALLQAADMVVLPSYGEGAPRSLIEAAACEKPLVATDVRGCREVVVDGVNGFLVPVRDAAGLSSAVLKLAADPALRAAMSQAGRRHVLQELDEQIVFRETYRTYQELLGSSARVPAQNSQLPA